MNIETNYEQKIGQSVSAAPKTSTTKTEQTKNTVFESQDTKKKFQLTEKEINYLVENGYDISKMTPAELEKALEPLFDDMASNKNPNGVNENSTSDKNISQNSSSDLAKSKISINYNDELLCQMGFDPVEAGIDACDFYSKLTEEEQQNFFIKSLAKNQYGANWDNLSKEEQTKQMESVESELAEKIPSWDKMTPNDRIKLGLAFLAGAEENSTLRNYGDEDIASLDVQIEKTINNIITERNNNEEILQKNFENEIKSRYGENPENLAGKQLEYLQQKVDKYGKESLNSYEKALFDSLDIQKEISGDESLSHIELNNKEENSFFYKMKNSDGFKSYVEKRKLEIYNSMGGSIEDAERAAQAEYAKQSFIDQFTDCKTREDCINKYEELMNSCTTTLERENLNKLKTYVLKGAEISSLEDAGYEAANLAESGDIEAQKTYGKRVAQAVKEGRISQQEVGSVPVTIKHSFNEKAVSTSTAEIIAVSEEAAKKFGELQKTEGYTKEQQKEVHSLILENKECNKKSKLIMAENIGLADDDVEIEIQEQYTKQAVTNKDADLMCAVAKGTSNYSKANQVKANKNAMQASKSFDKEDAIKIQSVLADQVEKAHKDNQLAMHEEIMKSEYSEVQERAAANIKNYDHSVQSKAIDVVYESGNSNAVKAVVENLEKMPPDIQKNEVSRLIGEIVLNGAVTEGNLNVKLMGGELTARDLSQLTASQRKEYFMKQFEEAPPAKKLEILMKMASSMNGIHQRTIYTVIARFSPSLLKGMVDRGMGKTMLEAGLPIDAVNKIIGIMKTSTNNEVIAQLQELRQDSSFAKYFADEKDNNKNRNVQRSDDLKMAFASPIDRPTYKKLKENNSTMYIKS